MFIPNKPGYPDFAWDYYKRMKKFPFLSNMILENWMVLHKEIIVHRVSEICVDNFIVSVPWFLFWGIFWGIDS